MPARRRVLIVQPSLQPPGGGQSVCAWMIQALQDEHHVGLATWMPVDVDAVNRWYGTSIRASAITTHVTPAGIWRALDSGPGRLALLKAALLLRFSRRLGAEYDVLISAENEADLGRPAIQYIHYPRLLRPRPSWDLRWYHQSNTVLAAYYATCARIMGGSLDQAARNVTMANSTWTAQRMRELCPESRVTVVHPPVPGDFPDTDWAERENGFLCIGRFSQEKNLGQVIEILAAVRRVVPDIHLHLVGSRGTRADYRRLETAARPHAAWVRIDHDLSRADLVRLIATHRYGIHGMTEEHFGIAPAEMVRAGCVVFLPASGGQTDIVGQDERVLYRTPAEAVAKIVRVLTSPAEQETLRTYFAGRRDLFSVERFMRTIRNAVERFPDEPDREPVR